MTSTEQGPPSGPPRPPDEVESLNHSSPSSPEEDLGSFFRILAASFAHARAGQETRSSREASQNPQTRGAGPKPTRRMLPRPILLAAGLLALLAWAAPLLLAAKEVVVPDTLIGSWKTSAPLYRDRGFTITSTSLVLKAGPDETSVSVHPITRVRTTHSGEAMAYTIAYLVEQSPAEFSFRLWPGSPAVIRAVHQPEIAWRKESR